MPLVWANMGQQCKIESIALTPERRMRIVNMGLAPGCMVQVLNRCADKLIVKVGETRVVLECGLAQQIHVQ